MKSIHAKLEGIVRSRVLRTIAFIAWTLIAAFSPVAVRADANPANDTGAFVLRILPSVDLGVTIDTTGAHWFGAPDLDMTSDMGATTRLETGVTLTVTGNFNNQELQIAAVANDTWQLDTDETPGLDQLRLYALIGANQSASAPTAALFSGTANLVTETPARAGQPQADEGGDANHSYEFSTAQSPEYQDIDGMEVGTVRRMWLRVDTPPTTTSDEEQSFTITVTAVSGAGF